RNSWLGRTSQPLDESVRLTRWSWLGGCRITQGIEEIGIRQSIPKRLERRRGIEQIHADDSVVAANQDASSPIRQHQAFGMFLQRLLGGIECIRQGGRFGLSGNARQA